MFWVMEPEYTRRILGRDNVILRQKFFLPAERALGTRRVVLLGESAAAGYPLPAYGLARVMKVLWDAEFPSEKIELVDMTSVGINSHVLRIFAREAMRLQPDALIIYAGHNEVIGPYGPANVFGWPAPNVWFAQAGLALSNTRTGRAGKLLAEKLAGREPGEWRGLEEFRNARFGMDDPGVIQAAALAKENFRAIVATALGAGVKVLVCVPAVNLTDWPPLVGGKDDDQQSAQEAYEKAGHLVAAGKKTEAWHFYRLASDLDKMRFRAESRVRQGQREVVTEFASPKVRLVDADLWLHEQNPGPWSDRDFFLEHVHLTMEGRVAVAALLVDGLAELLGVSPGAQQESSSWWSALPGRVAEARDRTMFTELEEAVMWSEIASLLQMDVFSSGAGMDERRKQTAARAAELRAAAEKWRDVKLVQKAYAQAVAENPEDADLHDTAFKHFGPAGDRGQARSALERAVQLRPNHVLANLGLADLAMDQGRVDDAERIAKAAAAFQAGGTELDAIHAELLAGQGKNWEAVALLERYVRRWPADARAIANLALLHDRLNHRVRARELYETALAQRPDSPGLLNNLAWLLANDPRANDIERQHAVYMARRAVELEPRAHLYQGTLAIALLAAGQGPQAEIQAQRAAAMAREAGDDEALQTLQGKLGRKLLDP